MSEKLAVAEAPEPPRKLGTVLCELAEGSSLHGLPKIVSARYLMVKILWLILLLGKYDLVPLSFANVFLTFQNITSGIG